MTLLNFAECNQKVGNHVSLTHRIMFRSREVQISPEPEKEVSGNYELEQIPAFDAIQVFKRNVVKRIVFVSLLVRILLDIKG